MKDYLLKMWRGEFSHDRAFWVHWFIPQFAIYPLLFLGIFQFKEVYGHGDTPLSIFADTLPYFTLIMVVLYYLLSLVGWFWSTINYKGNLAIKILSFLAFALVIVKSIVTLHI